MNRKSADHFRNFFWDSLMFITWTVLLSVVIGCAATPIQRGPAPQTGGGSAQDSGVEPKERISGGKESVKEEAKFVPPKSIAVWVPKGSGAFFVDSHRVFHGIGGGAGSSNPILLRASADNRSREELAEILDQFVTFVTETYWNKDGGKSSSQVGNLDVLKNAFVAVTKNVLSSSKISGHWQDPKSGEFYSLCQLPLSELIGAVAEDKRLDGRSKAYFLENAEKLYDQFSQAGGVEAS